MALLVKLVFRLFKSNGCNIAFNVSPHRVDQAFFWMFKVAFLIPVSITPHLFLITGLKQVITPIIVWTWPWKNLDGGEILLDMLERGKKKKKSKHTDCLQLCGWRRHIRGESNEMFSSALQEILGQRPESDRDLWSSPLGKQAHYFLRKGVGGWWGGGSAVLAMRMYFSIYLFFFKHQLPCVCSGRKCESPWFDGGLDDRRHNALWETDEVRRSTWSRTKSRCLCLATGGVSLGSLKVHVFIKGPFVEEVAVKHKKYIH